MLPKSYGITRGPGNQNKNNQTQIKPCSERILTKLTYMGVNEFLLLYIDAY